MRKLLAILIEEIGADMLRCVQIIEILPQLRCAALFIGGNRVIQRGGTHGFPSGITGTESQRDENGEHQEEG